MIDEEIEILYNTIFGGWGISQHVSDLYKLKKENVDISNLYYDLSYRTDQILIEIYKELGDEFDDKYSKTKIKKIPKKYENYFNIEEYDGREHIEINYTQYKLDKIYNKIKNIIESPNSNNIKINEIENFIKTFEI